MTDPLLLQIPLQSEPFVLYQAPLLAAYAERLIHGFTGKPVTLGGPDGLTEAIRENRRTVCRVAGLNAERLLLPRQVHGEAFHVNEAPLEEGADAILLTETGVPAMVQTADCVPVILYAPDRHVGAVIHAGWRGTSQAIVQKLAHTLIDRYRVSADQLIAAIGPAIGGCCYEVSPDVADAVGATIPRQSRERYAIMQENGKPILDLKTVNAIQLKALGVYRIDVVEACTRCREDELWSYRRGEAGRQVAYLQLL